MILKNTDDKSKELQTLQNLLDCSQSESQKELIRKDLATKKSGYEAEKKSAYLIDFYLKDTKNTCVIHDLRIEHNGRSAQIDHLLINRLEIVLLESKSFKGVLEIKLDGSLQVDYNGKLVTYPNPLEQSKRHAEVLKKILQENNFLKNSLGLELDFVCHTIISPDTTIKNDVLPENFHKADSFVSVWRDRVENASFFKATKLLLSSKSKDSILDMGKFLVSNHRPILFDYEKKYKISKPIENKKVEAKTNKPLVQKFVPVVEVKEAEPKDVESKLALALKKFRYEVAVKKRLKPYMVFGDKTLLEIVDKLPKNKDNLLLINGIGPQKVEEYGEDIISLIIKYNK